MDGERSEDATAVLALVYLSAGAWIFVSAPIAFLLTSGLIRLLQ